MRSLSKLIALASFALLLSCATKPTQPAAPPAPAPPSLVAVSPPARSTGVPEDPEMWADFAVDLDSASVNTRNVFLKLYTVRLPASISYDRSIRRIRVTPLVGLTLRETYSIEFTPNLHANGSPVFPSGYFWEFTIRGIRSATPRYPPIGAIDVSPAAPLAWTGTESSAGNISYTVYAAVDSAAVATRTATGQTHTGTPILLTQSAWPAGERIYWAVTARNLSTGEALDGPESSFTTLVTSSPPESLSFGPLLHGVYLRDDHRFACGGTIFALGSRYRFAVRWPVEQLPQDAIVVGARMEFRTWQRRLPAGVALAVRATADDWTSCTMGDPGPPFLDDTYPALAGSFQPGGSDSLLSVLESPLLTSHLCGAAAGIGLHGYVLDLNGPDQVFVAPDSRSLTVYFHRPPVALARSALRPPPR